MHMRFLTVSVLVAGLCVWTGDVRAQGSAETDRAALEAVYHATGGAGWTDNANWLSAEPLGDWYGVETNEQGRVTGLRLGGWEESVQEHVGNGLTGALPSEFGTLSQLLGLEIGGNSGLTGPIPATLGDLTELESLSLQENWLTGSIPAALGRLPNLQWLGLNHNALTGAIPTELGNLVGLHRLSLYGNLLSGQVPAELGSITGLLDLDLGSNQLSGPLPATVTRLSFLGRLQLDNSGLCVPDTADARAWLATIAEFMGVVCDPTSSLAFRRVVTQPGLGVFDSVVAVADLDGDGRDDILARDYLDYNVEREDRLTKSPLHVLVNVGDGSFRHAPELVAGTIDVRTPIVVADDFNGDGRDDLAVFDAGVYVLAESVGVGNPPQLFLSSPDGRLRPSEALADAVRREHALRFPRYGRAPSGPADLHLKSATSGDIDGDGDIDLWVDSIGGANVSSHFMVNNGDGTFTIEEERAPTALRYNPPEAWYHLEGHLVDLDNDGDIDLALAQNRGRDPTTINQSSIVLINDGTGHYPVRIELPLPAFADGFTSVTGQTHFDVNGDGFQDLLLVHPRNDDGPPDVIPWTGRYVQVLVNRGGTSFADETPTWMGDQSDTTPERDPDGEPLYNDAPPRMHDVDRDGCADLVMWRNTNVRTESPLVYLNDGSGRFRSTSPVPFAGSDHYFGSNAVPADVNGDAAIDFVLPWHHNGPDGRSDTADDFTALVTLLNTTPSGPVRCRPRVTTVGTLPARTLYVGAGAVAVVVPVGGAFRNASTYRASSSAPGVATVSVSGSDVTITPVAAGVATITVTATGADNSVATQRFRVTVLAATMFSDRLIPGTTPPRALHFLELRTRIAALRTREGLPPVRWTDPVLTVGVTPVKRIHLTELRAALDAVYDAARRPRTTYTDSIVTAGMTAIQSVHVVELRDAILALE